MSINSQSSSNDFLFINCAKIFKGITEIATDSWKRSCKSKTITQETPSFSCPFIPEKLKMIHDVISLFNVYFNYITNITLGFFHFND